MNIEKCLTLTKEARENELKLTELEEYLTNLLIEQTAKAKGGNAEKTRYKTAKKYIDTNIKKGFRENIKGIWTENEYQYFTNTFSGFKLINHIEGLKLIPDNMDKLPLEKIFKDFKSNEYNKVEIPFLNDLKTEVKLAKTEKREAKTLINKAYFNTKFLIECIEILGGNIEGYTTDSELSMLLLKSENGESMLCPIRVPKEERKTA